MQTPDKSGISCDLCGGIYKDDFTYVSIDVREINSFGQSFPLIIMLRQPVLYCVDACSLCFSGMAKAVVANNQKVAKGAKICELTGAPLDDTYYYCVCDKVSVAISRGTQVCANCGAAASAMGGCAKCGGKEVRRVANVNADARSLEFKICAAASADLHGKLQRRIAQQSQQSTWETRT